MGLNIKDIVPTKEISIDDLSGKRLAIDSFNMLYQFLTTIRQQDGTPLTDSHGRVTSHLSGLFHRSVNFLDKGIKPVFVFDGKAPNLKAKERERRDELKREALREYEIAKERADIIAMKKYAGRTTRLSKEMVDEAKELISAMGMPIVQAKSEGEAQAAYLAKKGDCYATVSQDFDTILYSTPQLVRNLSISGRRKIAGKVGYVNINPEVISHNEVLSKLGLTNDQMIVLAILVGTDYNIGGIKGIGPAKALKLVKEHSKTSFGSMHNPDDFDSVFKAAQFEKHFDVPWQDIYNLFKTMPVNEDYSLRWTESDADKIKNIMCSQHDFSRERIDSALERLENGKKGRMQKGLGEFF
jgi:flap endonuclease-1